MLGSLTVLCVAPAGARDGELTLSSPFRSVCKSAARQTTTLTNLPFTTITLRMALPSIHFWTFGSAKAISRI
jgi:hypothetical protein